ncbi:MAG: hypothetical protein ACK4PR_09680 [Gammaproteobacteria bacterium]
MFDEINGGFQVNAIVVIILPALRAGLDEAYSINHLPITLLVNLQCLLARFNAGYDGCRSPPPAS